MAKDKDTGGQHDSSRNHEKKQPWDPKKVGQPKDDGGKHSGGKK